MFPDASQLRSLQEQLSSDLYAFGPELILCGSIVLLLLARLFKVFDGLHRSGPAELAVAAALALVASQWFGTDQGFGETFSKLLMLDPWANWFRGFILLATLLVLVLGRLTG